MRIIQGKIVGNGQQYNYTSGEREKPWVWVGCELSECLQRNKRCSKEQGDI